MRPSDGSAGAGFRLIAEVPGDPRTMRVYEHGWQSWSPAGLYPATTTSPRPARVLWQSMAFRPELPAPATGFQSEGLLAIVPADGPVRTWATPDPTATVPSIRVHARADRLEVHANGDVVELAPVPTLPDALAGAAAHLSPAGPSARSHAGIGPGWCSYYGYGLAITADTIQGNLDAMERLGLPIATVQVDDGYAAGIGDWTTAAPGFGSIADVASRIRDTGREAGIWTAPFCVGMESAVAREHPEWLVGGAIASPDHWGQEVRVLDVTHPEAAAHLADTFRTLRGWGYTFHKIDFVYAGAIPGGRHADASPIAAYRLGLQIIRDALGPNATLLACGAPLLPSIGLVDAMRVSPDVDLRMDHPSGDISQPSMRAALAMGRARSWMHARLWTNDPDCLIVREEMAGREAWAAHVSAAGGLVISGDRLDELDDRGLDLLRRGLRASGATPVRWDPDGGPDGGRIIANGGH
jgi:alpha-galactosidase